MKGAWSDEAMTYGQSSQLLHSGHDVDEKIKVSYMLCHYVLKIKKTHDGLEI